MTISMKEDNKQTILYDALQRSIIASAKQLLSYLGEENLYLKNDEIDKLVRIQNQKLAVIERFEDLKKLLPFTQKQDSDLEKENNQEILGLQQEINKSLEENLTGLTRAKIINQQINNFITQMITRQKEQEFGYNNQGRIKSDKVQRSLSPMNLNDII